MLKPKKYELNGEQLTIKQIAERSDLPASRIRRRISRGWTPSEAVEVKKMSSSQAGRIGKRRSPFCNCFDIISISFSSYGRRKEASQKIFR